MEPKEKKAFEPSGLVPRSIVRTFERFRQQLLPGSETAAIREYRISRYQVLVSARCLFTLLIIPIATNWLVSSWLLSPLVEHFWNTRQNEIFLNSYQEERAFAELESFSEKLFFESLLNTNTTNTINADQLHTFSYALPITQCKASLCKGYTKQSFALSKAQFFSEPSCEKNPSSKNFSSSNKSSVTDKLILYDKSSICKICTFINDTVIKNLPTDEYINSVPDTFYKASLCTGSAKRSFVYPERVMGFLLDPERVKNRYSAVPFAKQSFVHPERVMGFLRTRSRGVSFASAKVYPALYKSSICAAKVNSPFNKFSTVSNSSVFDSIETSKELQGNGVKAWGTEVKAPFLLSVPIESTYDNSLKIKEKVQNKILELAVYYNQQTIRSITNIVGDIVSLVTLGCLFIWMKPEITILKSFLIEAIYSLSDTTKSFLLILLTDLLVGFHSPRGWETALELLLKHFGLPENQDFVFLFVATFPVLLDTVFKYWIFRHLNKISPSTVATYHSMIE